MAGITDTENEHSVPRSRPISPGPATRARRSEMDVMPKWADVILIPLISLLLAAVHFRRW